MVYTIEAKASVQSNEGKDPIHICLNLQMTEKNDNYYVVCGTVSEETTVAQDATSSKTTMETICGSCLRISNFLSISVRSPRFNDTVYQIYLNEEDLTLQGNVLSYETPDNSILGVTVPRVTGRLLLDDYNVIGK